MDIIKKGFGSRLKIIRIMNKLTQEKLSEKIDINLRQLARIEAGESFVSSETLYNICSVLSISPDVLFDFDLEEEALMTGARQNLHFSVIKTGNVIKLVSATKNNAYFSEQDYNFLCKVFDEKMAAMSKRVGKEIFVDEVKDGNVIATKIFRPDGDAETIRKQNIETQLDILKEKITSISKDEKKLEFMNLAYDALSNKNALNELKMMIRGIEITQ